MPKRLESTEEETKRLEVLKSYDILDSVREEEFDALTRLASYVCGTPVALITLLDDKRQWFKASLGINATQTRREDSFCRHALWSDEVLEVPDATQDERFKENPYVTGDPDIRFYAGAPLETPEGYNLGTLCVVDRIPRQLSAEQKDALKTIAAQVMAQLELRKKNRTLQLEKASIEELSKAKETFFANMSHEIRTPLNAVIGFTDVLMTTSLSDSQQDYTRNILYAGEKLLLLINDILDLSKLSSGSMHLETRPFDLAEVLQKNYALFKLTAIEKNLEYSFEVAPGVPQFVCGDSLRLSQVLMNLVNNAFKFTETGGVKVKIECVEKMHETAVLRFSVTDTGIGIAPENLRKIFNRFQQAEDDTSRRFGGSGLGLNISNSLLQLQNSSLEVSSKVGEGSTFSFRLEFPVASDILPVASGTQNVHSDKFYRVLLCEDVVLNQKLMQNILTPERFHLRIANNGKEGIEWLKKEEFDLVLMDLQMPEMDGYETTDFIRNKLHSSVPVIALTAHSLEGDMQKCLEAGMNDYLSKPFRLDALLAKIHNIEPKVTGEKIEAHTDLSYLHSISGGDKDFERHMLETFLRETREEVVKLAESLEKKEAGPIAAIAHKLKSTVPFAGLTYLIPSLEKLEKIRNERELTENQYSLAGQLLNQLKKQLGNLELMLDTGNHDSSRQHSA